LLLNVGGRIYSSGVELLNKVIIWESQHLDTNATTNSTIQTKLSNLGTYITMENSDIGLLFNQHVKQTLIQSFTARNQETSDLLLNLFKGYLAVSDETFRAWLGQKQDNNDEGEELTPDG
jgi:arginine deiminase